MTRSISVVTTFHQAGYEKYGQRMITTFLQNWPANVTLHVYAENCTVKEQADNLRVYDLHAVSPEIVNFKNKWANVPHANGDITSMPHLMGRKDKTKSFKWDAIRFSHKVYSIFHCANTCNSDLLLWMDADTVCHEPISHDRIEQLCQEDKDLCYLGRKGKYSECGLYSLNLRSDNCQLFLKEFQRMYDHAEIGIFNLIEWHDSFVFDAVRQKIPSLKLLDWSSHLISGEGHPLINSEWGAYLDHLKGDRKNVGHSNLGDLKIARKEKYWSRLK